MIKYCAHHLNEKMQLNQFFNLNDTFIQALISPPLKWLPHAEYACAVLAVCP